MKLSPTAYEVIEQFFKKFVLQQGYKYVYIYRKVHKYIYNM